MISFEELDPELEHGFKLVYETELNIDLYFKGISQVQKLVDQDIYKIQFYANRDMKYKLIITNENDLQFNYRLMVDRKSFRLIKEQNEFRFEYDHFRDMFIDTLSKKVIGEDLKLILFIQNEHNILFDVSQIVEHRQNQLMNLNFKKQDRDGLRKYVSFKYNALRARMMICDTQLNRYYKLIKEQDPSLLQMITQ